MIGSKILKNPLGRNLRKMAFSKWPPEFWWNWENLYFRIIMSFIAAQRCTKLIYNDNLWYLMGLGEIFDTNLTKFERPLSVKAKYGITSSFFTLWSWNKCLHVGFQGQQTQLCGQIISMICPQFCRTYFHGRPLPDIANYVITSPFFTLWPWNKCLHVGFQGQQTQLWGHIICKIYFKFCGTYFQINLVANIARPSWLSLSIVHCQW